MIVLLPGSPKSYRFKTDYPREYWGWLLAPKRGPMTFSREYLVDAMWASDNSCFSLGDKFDFDKYVRYLERLVDAPGRCLFVTVPDVVADARATHENYLKYARDMRPLGFPIAYVAQDGLMNLPKVKYDAVFIGGTTEYKLGPIARRLVVEAKHTGKWVHMGRVNGIARMKYAHTIGVDSIDGTCFALAPLRHLKWARNELNRQNRQIRLESI